MNPKREMLTQALLSAWLITSATLLVYAYYEGAFSNYSWWLAPALFVFSVLVAYAGERGRQRRRMRYPADYKPMDVPQEQRLG